MIADIEPKVALHDLGTLRRLSPETLVRFTVTDLPATHEWGWPAYTPTAKSFRRKSWHSNVEDAPEILQADWKKYRWYPSKPDDAVLFSPGGLVAAIKAANGVLWLTGGEIAVMTLYEVGLPNSTCFFGDNAASKTVLEDLRQLEVKQVIAVLDRDKSSELLARKVKSQLEGSAITFTNRELPYPLTASHGLDVNDYWLGWQHSKEDFVAALNELPLWDVPLLEPPAPKTIQFPGLRPDDHDPLYVPPRAIALVKSLLGIREEYNSEGWTRHKVPCPFHADEHASFDWNDQLNCGRCQSACGRSFNVKEILAVKGYTSFADFFDAPLTLNGNGSSPHVDLNAVPPEPTLPIVNEENKRPPLTLPTQPLPVNPKNVRQVTTSQLRPPLPNNTELTTEQQALAAMGRGWLDKYVDWAFRAAPLAPALLHEAIGLWLVASTIARRVCLQVKRERIFPNLYVFILAEPSDVTKSEALNLAQEVLALTGLNPLRLPREATPEALYENMAGMKPKNFDDLPTLDQLEFNLTRVFAAQRTIIEDEAGSILSGMKKEYNEGVEVLLLKGYDANMYPLTKQTKGAGRTTIRDLSLCFLGASTPTHWQRHMGPDQYESGLAGRFAIITPDVIYLNDAHAPDEVEEPTAIVNRLKTLFYRILPWPFNPLDAGGRPSIPEIEEVKSPPINTASITPEAFAQFKKYREAIRAIQQSGVLDFKKKTCYGKLGTLTMKVALNLAAVNATTSDIRVEARHYYAAQEIVEKWRESLHRLDEIIASNTADDTNDRVFNRIQQAGTEGIRIRDLSRAIHLPADKTRREVAELLAEKLIEVVSRKAENNRMVDFYRVIIAKSEESHSVTVESPSVTNPPSDSVTSVT